MSQNMPIDISIAGKTRPSLFSRKKCAGMQIHTWNRGIKRILLERKGHHALPCDANIRWEFVITTLKFIKLNHYRL